MGFRMKIEVQVSASEAQLLSRRPGALRLPKSSPLRLGVRIISGYCLNLCFLFLNGYRFVGAILRESGWHDGSAPGAVAGANESFGTAVLRIQEQQLQQQSLYLEGSSEHGVSGPFSAFLILVFKEAEEPEIKLPTFTGSWRKQGISRKTSTSASLTI